MYEIYYYDASADVFTFQSRFNTLKDAKASYNEDRKGYIKCGERVLKRYSGCN